MVRRAPTRTARELARRAGRQQGLLGGHPLRRSDRRAHGLADLLIRDRRGGARGAGRRTARGPQDDARDRPPSPHRAPQDLHEEVLRTWRGGLRGLHPRRRPVGARPRAAHRRVRLRLRDQPRTADPVPVLDLHGAARGRARADPLGRQDDREPGPGAVGRGARPGGHRGVPPAAVPLPRRVRGVGLRGPPEGAPPEGADRRRHLRAHHGAERGAAERPRVPQLLLAPDDRRATRRRGTPSPPACWP